MKRCFYSSPVNLTYPCNVQHTFCKSFLFHGHFAANVCLYPSCLKITASYWLRTFHYFCSEHHCCSSSSHWLSCCMKFNRPRCSHVCLLWYGSSQVSSAIGKNNRNSEWFFIIKWGPLCGTGTNFRKKMKHHIFFQSDIWADIYVCFYQTFTFFIGKTDKTDSFQ